MIITCTRSGCNSEISKSAKKYCSHACYSTDRSERVHANLWESDRRNGIPDDCRKCNKCGEIKNLSNFHKNLQDYKLTNRKCKPCVSNYYVNEYSTKERKARAANRSRERYAANSDKLREKSKQQWASGVKKEQRYGMAKGAWEILFDSQGQRCANKACPEPEGARSKVWHTDHDPSCCPGRKSCGKCVRGILCQCCNQALGLLRDDHRVILGLAVYLVNRR